MFLETEGNWPQNISLIIEYFRMEKITMDYKLHAGKLLG